MVEASSAAEREWMRSMVRLDGRNGENKVEMGCRGGKGRDAALLYSPMFALKRQSKRVNIG